VVGSLPATGTDPTVALLAASVLLAIGLTLAGVARHRGGVSFNTSTAQRRTR
jgi:LPXTG-motif cell wall-anchored protein